MEKVKILMLDNPESLSDILDGMYDWVRVVDADNNVIFMNKSMSDAVGEYIPGTKCFSAVGKSTPCDICTSRKAVFKGYSFTKEEIINGRIFSVMSSPVRNKEGEIIAAVEVLRDITAMKVMEEKILQQHKKLSDDLEIAKKLQYSLLPKEHSEERYSFSFIYKPCESLGGDYLDIFAIDNDHIGIYIADVSGHGVPASMLTVFLHSTIDKTLLSPSDALSGLYKEFNKSNLDKELYITVFYAIIDFRKGNITYSNAGHNVCPVLYNSEGLNILMSAGTPISNWIEGNPAYTDKVLPFKSGDKLFLSTDGAIEIKNACNEMLGQERLINMLTKDKSPSSEALNNVLNIIYEFSGIKDPSDIIDDITMALLEFK